ncbi:hypothetical protein PR1_9 [Providencia phage vB_PreS_PR1]|uniref:Uncharacterized protein n=1 Tax=Providencia phage vB_PreS_PR1 TaxID=1931407 RepID=A0A1S6KV40_9CAUD|nr:hypothetical protein FDH30_gp009 [Providencia phage vB_PreS_PR1]AQT25284.1 hypothetical protein PR1_9 [Providencia phage vB_PreS_PR1]
MAKVINFECVHVLNIRTTGQALTWESALEQISKCTKCQYVTVTLGRLVFRIDWLILASIYESLQLNMPFSVAVGGEVWYIEQYQDVEQLFYNVSVSRLFMKEGVAYYVGDIIGLCGKVTKGQGITNHSTVNFS